jgi:hypothetical protein
VLSPIIRRPRRSAGLPSTERGFTMALVAVALVSIIAMAALSIDIGTFYQAKAEAQRSADAAALTAARVISISGITGDPTNDTNSWQKVCGGTSSPATMAAQNVAQQNLIAGLAIPSKQITVTYVAGETGKFDTDCSELGTAFGVNPIVTVKVQGGKLPIFFARVFSLLPNGNFSGTSVSATASAEAFNPSNSANVAGKMIPVQPRCVKPWIIPNIDPGNGGASFVATNDGSISNGGVSQLGEGVIGEKFNLNADCVRGAADCVPTPPTPGNMLNNPPQLHSSPPFLEYVPALISGTPGALPSCPLTPGYQGAIAGCDQSSVYACGTAGGAHVDLSENPANSGSGVAGDTSTGVQCLINQSVGSDTLLTGDTKAPLFPFQILAGGGNPLVLAGLVSSGDIISSSSSIVTIPIYDSNPAVKLVGSQPQVTIVGFLQVFINGVDTTTTNTTGIINVTVLNVAGCSNDAKTAPVSGTSPVPVRLITPP